MSESESPTDQEKHNWAKYYAEISIQENKIILSEAEWTFVLTEQKLYTWSISLKALNNASTSSQF